MDSAPNLRHLRLFLAAFRTGRLSRAAEAVHLSQPAATQALRGLEAALGQKLFERGSSGLIPSDAAIGFQARVERGFEWLRQAQRLVGTTAVRLDTGVSIVQLRALIAIVDQGGFTLAARQLGVSQPSVHRAARSLEALCQRPLFQVHAQGLEATAAARDLARCAALMLAEIEQGMAELRELRGILDGRVWVGCLPLARTRLLPLAVTRLLERYPEVRVRIIDGAYPELLYGLRHSRLDMIVGALRLPPPSGDIVQEAFFAEQLSIVMRADHPLATADAVRPEDLARLDWVVPRDGTPARARFSAFFRDAGLAPPAHIIECSSLVALRGLLMASERVGLASAEQVRYEVDAGFLRILPTPLPGTDRPIGLTTRRDWQPTRVQAAFIALLRQLAPATPGS